MVFANMLRRSVLVAIILNVFILTFSVLASDRQAVEIKFAATVGDRIFSCSEEYDGIGTTGSKMTVTDLRFFVQDVRLIDKKGRVVAVELVNDEKFQTERVALLDFENGSGPCRNGTADTNTIIRGTAPKGSYAGLRFKIGVPTDLNHLDPTKAPSPLNITRMLWSWQMGYKFARIDARTTGRPGGYVLHLGSTECKADASTNVTTCANSNRPEFSFAKFDAAKDVVAFDLKRLFAGANVDTNQERTAAGCMSFSGDSDCAPVFSNLGLSFDGRHAKPQSVVKLVRGLAAGSAVAGTKR